MAGNLVRRRGGSDDFALGPPTNAFTGIQARTAYGVANPTWLASYDAHPGWYLSVTTGGNTTFYRRWNSAWASLSVALRGGIGPTGNPGSKGNKGDEGNPGNFYVQLWQAAAGAPPAPTTYSIASTGLVTGINNGWSTSPVEPTGENGLWTIVAMVSGASDFPLTTGVTWSNVVDIRGDRGPQGDYQPVTTRAVRYPYQSDGGSGDGTLGFTPATDNAGNDAGAWADYTHVALNRYAYPADQDPLSPDSDPTLDLRALFNRSVDDGEPLQIRIAFDASNWAEFAVNNASVTDAKYQWAIGWIIASAGQKPATNGATSTDVSLTYDQRRPTQEYIGQAVANSPEFAGTPDGLIAEQGGQAKHYDFNDARRHLLGPKNHVALGTFAVESNIPSEGGQVNVGSEVSGLRQVNITWNTTDEENDLTAYLIVGQELQIGSLAGEIVGNAPTKNTVANGGFQFNIGELTGTAPSGNVTVTAKGQEVATRVARLTSNVFNTSNAYRGDSEPGLLAYDDGTLLLFKPNVTNTGAATLNVSGLGDVDIVDAAGAALSSGDLTAGKRYLLAYDDGKWHQLT